MPQLLFLCSGNYYRSRFAEIVFNHLAEQQQHRWRAVSRGFRLHPGNVGPISRHAVQGLQSLGIPLPEPRRDPLTATLADLSAADRIIAVKEAEHRPMMLERFPEWVERVEYWQIDDLDCARPSTALPLLEDRVRKLLEQLIRH